MNIEIIMTEEKEQPVLSVRKSMAVANLPQELGKAYGSIMSYLAETGQQPAGMPFAAYYNMDMENLDVEMGFPVAKPIAGKGEIKQSSVPAGKQASCMYKGPYADMAPAYEAMTKWISDNGYTPTGVCYEFYYNSPMEVPESVLLTKIVFLLK